MVRIGLDALLAEARESNKILSEENERLTKEVITLGGIISEAARINLPPGKISPLRYGDELEIQIARTKELMKQDKTEKGTP